jgi:putative ABC transport system permease protein
MAQTLGLATASRIAWRETRASSARFLFVVLSIAVGVGALTGVRAFSSAFRHELLSKARSILAADVSASLTHQLTPDDEQKLSAMLPAGARRTQITQTISMVSTPQDPNPLLVSLKILDPAEYPFYGDVALEDGKKLHDVLNDGTAVVGDDLLIRLHTQVGETLQVGSLTLRIADVVSGEPDALVESFNLGPRVMITRASAEKAGLLQPGSRASERYLFALPAKVDVSDFRAKLQTILPEAQVTDFRETNPTITQGVDRATSVLSLVSLIAMVLGAIAVAMAMRAHLQQRMDSIAMMKALGATSSHILRIYVLQTIFLGSAGGALGVIFGVLVDRLMPHLFRSLIHISPGNGVTLEAAAIGFFTGLLTTQLFTLPSLLEVRRVRPVFILRRQMQEENFGYASWKSRAGLQQRLPQLAAVATILAGLSVIAAVLSNSKFLGIAFTAGLATALLALLAAAKVMLWLLRRLLAGTRLLWIPQSVRHGLANLYRPGNQTASVLAALGVGVMLSMTIFFIQKTVIADLRNTTPADLPNAFFVDISPNEVEGVRTMVNKLPGVSGPMDMIPVVAARFSAINGHPPSNRPDKEPMADRGRTGERTVSLSWVKEVPTGVSVKQGTWFAPDEKSAVVSVSEREAQRFNLHPGDLLTFQITGQRLDARIVAVHSFNNLRAGSRSEFLFPPAPLAGYPTIWYGAVHMQPDQVPALQRAMFANYPTVTVVNLADALRIINTVVDNIARTIEFLAAFCIFSAVILLASSIAGTRFRRIRETVVLKTLGATRARIGAMLTAEFLLLGSLGAAVGLVFAHLLAWSLLHRFELHYQFQGWATLLAIAATAALASIAGWAACYRILGQKPLAVLREE